MERALRLLLGWGLEARTLRTVIWWAHAGNWASRKLAWRVGFSYDGCIRQWLTDRGDLVDGWVGTLVAGEPLQPREDWESASRR
jgi:RimJ/RimL family protein N-acetyltransferase